MLVLPGNKFTDICRISLSPEPVKKIPQKGNLNITSRNGAILVFAFAFLVFGNSIFNNYNLDDELVTIDHLKTSQGFSAIPEIWTSPYYEDEFNRSYEYRPVVLTTFAIEHHLFGENPITSHLFNVLLYAATCVLLFYVLSLMLPGLSLLLPLAATVLFLVHPIHTEVVASIKNRDELLALFFGLVALFAALRFSKGSFVWLLVSIAAFFLSLASKRSGVPLALLIPLSLVFFTTASPRKVLALGVPLAILAVLFTPIPFIWQKALLVIAIVAFPHSMKLKRQDVVQVFQVVVRGGSGAFGKIRRAIVRSFVRLAGIDEQLDRPKSLQLLDVLLKVGIALMSFLMLLCMLFGKNEGATAFSLLVLGLTALLPNSKLGFWLVVLTVVGCISAYNFDFEYLTRGLIVVSGLLIFYGPTRLKRPAIISLCILFIPDALIYDWDDTLAFVGGFLVAFFLLKKFPVGWKAIPILVGCWLILDVAVLSDFEKFRDFESVWMALIIAGTVMLVSLKAFARRKAARIWMLMLPALLVLNFADSSFQLHSKLGPHINLSGTFNTNINSLRLKADKLLFDSKLVVDRAQKARSLNVVPTAGRKLNFVETPLLYSSGWSTRFGTSFYVLGQYVRLFFLPHPLSFYYGYSHVPLVKMTHWLAILTFLVFIGLVMAIVFFRRKYPLLSFSALWFVLCILPFSNLAAPMAGLMGERLAYFSSLGFCLLFVVVLGLIFKIDWEKVSLNKIPKPALILFSVVSLAFAIMSILRNEKWENQLTLMQHDIDHLESSAQANSLLGTHLVLAAIDGKANDAVANYQKAEDRFEKAVSIYPNFFNAWYDLGRTRLFLENKEAALQAFNRAIELDSTFVEASIQAALLADELDRVNEAIEHYYRAMLMQPTNISVFTNLSFVYFRIEDFESSINVNLRCIEFNPDAYEPHVNIGKTLLHLGDAEAAIPYLEKAWQLDQSDSQLLQNLLAVLREVGQTERADELARQFQ